MYKNSEFLRRFEKDDQVKIQKFFDLILKDIHLSKKDYRKLINDFENYLLYCGTVESISTILKRLPIDIITKGYKENNDWYPLDTSSKIYPLSMREEWMSIYRLSLYLKEDVAKDVLQLALDYTITRFPLFKTSIHKGFFWNYFDSINKRFKVEEESIPCSMIKISQNNNQCFRVLYYKNRISCEFFHVLADAHGGMVFLTTLVNEYLRLLGKKVSYNDYALKLDSKISDMELENAFLKEVKKEPGGKLMEKKAVQLDGKRSKIRPSQVIHFDLDLKKVSHLAKENGITINELLLSFLFVILSYSTSKDGEIKIQVPVNMRKFYPTKSLRNFSLYNTLGFPKKDIKSLEEMMPKVHDMSVQKLDKDSLDRVMFYAIKLVKSVTFLPLVIKNPITKFIFRFFGDTSSTTVLSNLGRIDLPEEMLKEVVGADFILGTAISNRILFSVVTIGNNLCLTLSKFTTNTSVENNLYSLLKEYDLLVRVHGSDKYEN